MRLAQLCRLAAIGIVLLCWLDPPVVVAPQPKVQVDVALVPGALADRPAGDASDISVAAALRETAARLADRLDGEADLHVEETTRAEHLPCDAVRPCVLLAGPGVAPVVPGDRRGLMAVVRAGEPLSANVEVTRMESAPAHVSSEGLARLHLRGRGVTGHDSLVRLYDGDTVVGEAIHTWIDDGDAAVDVSWWPLAAGRRRLDARVSTAGLIERTDSDNRAAVAVEVGDERWLVHVHERRPSWATTFVRRALEDDVRFALAARTDLAPRVNASPRADAGLTDEALERARVVVVGAPEVLSAGDVERLERFVYQRGGSLVLVPDRSFSGPVTRLLRHRWQERLVPAPLNAGGLRASEWLLADGTFESDEVTLRADGAPAVVTTPVGAGRVTVAGALDAWRHRDEGGEFARFWRGLVARAAMAAGPAFDVRVSPPWVRPGADVAVRVQLRTLRSSASVDVSAELHCGNDAPAVVRLWPSDEAGGLEGRLTAPAEPGTCEVTARAGALGDARVPLVVSLQPLLPGTGAGASEDEQIARAGGVVTTTASLDPVVQAVRDARSIDRVPEARHPMRSWWWMLPLAAGLSAEWWLRRRGGLR